MVLAKGKSVLRCGSAAARFATVLWPPTTAHCGCASVRSPKPGCITVIAGYTRCSGGKAGAITTKGFTGFTANRGCRCALNGHAAINPHSADNRSLKACIRITFVSDALFDGLQLRLLTVIDLYTRECLGICLGQNLRSTEVSEMLNSIAFRRPLPQMLKTENGSEFAGKMLDKWVYERGIRIDFSRPVTRRIMRRWSRSTAG